MTDQQTIEKRGQKNAMGALLTCPTFLLFYYILLLLPRTDRGHISKEDVPFPAPSFPELLERIDRGSSRVPGEKMNLISVGYWPVGSLGRTLENEL